MMYVCIDLKSFYASVECATRGLDPLDTNLVVADGSKTEKTICLAVTPSLKSFGIPGRARLFEVIQKMEEVNRIRLNNAPHRRFSGSSCSARELAADPTLKADYLIAPPRMASYMEMSDRIVGIYAKFVSAEDILAYSVDEVFIDVTKYLDVYKMTAHQLAMTMIREVLRETGITATAGIGTNMYLAKIAMDIRAKKMPADKDGVRIAELDEMSYRRELWSHTPLTDFWRIGGATARKLAANQMFTMGDVAECSVYNEDKLYRMFGVNAELLIDHAWGWEPCTIADAKAYVPDSHSISQGQVLSRAYQFEEGRLIVREMAELLVLELVRIRYVTDQVVLTVGYDHEGVPAEFSGIIAADRYGRKIPQQAHGSMNLDGYTSSSKTIVDAVVKLFERIVDKSLFVRRMYVVANNIIPEEQVKEEFVQLDLFSDPEVAEAERLDREKSERQERSLQQTMLSLKERFGKNALLKGMNFREGATTIERNGQVGGHKA